MNQSMCKMLIEHLIDAAGKALENTLFYFSGVFSRYPYPGSSDYVDNIYLLAVCGISTGDYKLAAESVNLIIKHVSTTTGKVDTDYLMLKKYIEGMQTIGNHDEVIRYLRYMFDGERCDRYDTIFREPSKAVMNLYPEVWVEDPYTSEFRQYEEMIIKFKAYMANHEVDPRKLAAVLKKIMERKDIV